MENLQANLSDVRELLLKEITNLSFEDFNWKPDINHWSVAQVCHHLVLVEEMFTDAISYGLKKTVDTEVKAKRIEIMKDRSRKVDAPEPSEPSSQPFQLEQIIQLLKDTRKQLLAHLSTIEDPTILEKKSVKHPIFGDLQLFQWVETVYLHEHRHIEQIKGVKQILSSHPTYENQ